MLVLSRKLDEEIFIAGGIKLKVVGIRGGRVRLGIEAPDSIIIERAEIARQKSVEDPLSTNGSVQTASG